MSAALVLAAQCYARPQDSMYHILVSQEQEANQNFFYPTDAQNDTSLILTPLPFFRMREHLPADFLRSPATLESLSYACMPKQPLRLTLNLTTHSLSFEGKSLNLPPALFAVYAFFARQTPTCPRHTGICPGECSACAMTWPDVALKLNDILQIYQSVEEKSLARGQKGILHLAAENFRSTLAKLKKILAQAFGPATGRQMSIVSVQQEYGVGYCLRIPRTQIFIESQRCDR